MKKPIALILLVTLLSMSVPNKSEAVLSLIMRKWHWALIGGAAFAGGIGTLPLDFCLAECTAGQTVLLALSDISMIFGVVMLDAGSDSWVPQFAALVPEDEARLQITAEELTVYNRELDQVNAIAQTIFIQLSSATGTERELFARSSGLWNEYEPGNLSPQSIQVLGKVSAYAVAHSH